MIRSTITRATEPAWPAFAGVYAIASCAVAAEIARWHAQTFVEMNAIVLLLWSTTTAVAIACAGQSFVHRRFGESVFVQHNEVGGFIVAVAGSLYGVLLGFMTVVAWQHFSASRDIVGAESAAATDAWHTSVGMPTAERTHVRGDVLRYAGVLVGSEWPAMRYRAFDKEADFILMDAIGSAGSFSPANFKESNAQSATLLQLGTIHDQRQRRLSENDSGISWFEWLVLIVGAACIVGFCWLFGLQNRNAHLAMTSTVAIIVTTTLVLLFELQYPFQSDLRIGPDDWTGVISHIETMQAGPQSAMRM